MAAEIAICGTAASPAVMLRSCIGDAGGKSLSSGRRRGCTMKLRCDGCCYLMETPTAVENDMRAAVIGATGVTGSNRGLSACLQPR